MSGKNTSTSFEAALGGSSPPKVPSGEGSAKVKPRRLTLDLTPDAHKAFRAKAAELDTSMKAMLTAFVEAVAEGDKAAQRVAERARGERR